MVGVNNWLQIRNAEAQANAYRSESERIFRQITNKNKIPTVTYLKRELQRGKSCLQWR